MAPCTRRSGGWKRSPPSWRVARRLQSALLPDWLRRDQDRRGGRPGSRALDPALSTAYGRQRALGWALGGLWLAAVARGVRGRQAAACPDQARPLTASVTGPGGPAP